MNFLRLIIFCSILNSCEISNSQHQQIYSPEILLAIFQNYCRLESSDFTKYKSKVLNQIIAIKSDIYHLNYSVAQNKIDSLLKEKSLTKLEENIVLLLKVSILNHTEFTTKSRQAVINKIIPSQLESDFTTEFLNLNILLEKAYIAKTQNNSSLALSRITLGLSTINASKFKAQIEKLSADFLRLKATILIDEPGAKYDNIAKMLNDCIRVYNHLGYKNDILLAKINLELLNSDFDNPSKRL